MTSYTEDLIRSIKRKDPAEKLDKIINICPKGDVLNWRDAERQDLLHYCIDTNSPEALELLLKRGLFVEPHQPEVKPYLHLAAKLGHRTIINLLLTHRLNDNRALQVSSLGIELSKRRRHDEKVILAQYILCTCTSI